MISENKRTTGILVNGHTANADAISAEGILPSMPKDDQGINN